MTVIAKISTRNAHIIIGDILVSGHETEEEISVPTIGGIYEILPKGSGWSVTDLKSKIHILGDNIVIGWYGNLLAAKTIITELKRINDATPISFNEIDNFLCNSNIIKIAGQCVENNSVGLTGFILENNIVKSFDYFSGKSCGNTAFDLPDDMGEIILYGSGTEDFKQYIGTYYEQIAHKFKSPNDSYLIHSFFLDTSSYFLTKEIVDKSTICPSYYGGYYDFAAFVDRRIINKEDYSHFFFTVVADQFGNPEINIQVEGFKTTHDHNKILKCFRWMSKNQNKVDLSLYYVPPIYMKTEEKQSYISSLKSGNFEFSFNSKYSCYRILVADPHDTNNEKWISSFSVITRDNHPVELIVSKQGIKHKVDPNFSKFIENETLKIWNSKSKK